MKIIKKIKCKLGLHRIDWNSVVYRNGFEKVTKIGRCVKCNRRFEKEDSFLICPYCGRNSVVLYKRKILFIRKRQYICKGCKSIWKEGS